MPTCLFQLANRRLIYCHTAKPDSDRSIAASSYQKLGWQNKIPSKTCNIRLAGFILANKAAVL